MADSNRPVSGSTNAPEVAETIRQQLATMKRGLKNQMMRALTLLEAEILQNIRSSSGLHVRTGALLNSVGSSKKVTTNSDGTVSGQIGSAGVPYARIKEFGGIISAKNRQYLTIPTQENRRPDGSPIVTTGQLRVMQRLGLAFIKDGIIFQRVLGKKQAATPMFILKKSVDSPAKPFLRPALAAKQDAIMQNFGIFIAAAFDANKGSGS